MNSNLYNLFGGREPKTLCVYDELSLSNHKEEIYEVIILHTAYLIEVNKINNYTDKYTILLGTISLDNQLKLELENLLWEYSQRLTEYLGDQFKFAFIKCQF